MMWSPNLSTPNRRTDVVIHEGNGNKGWCGGAGLREPSYLAQYLLERLDVFRAPRRLSNAG
ncbi:MAG: hypothetical protein VX427_16395 [Acidobacteriota bacterium]|nr:hypothetical protein [Acidobacteriota bacterium]